MTNIIDKRKLFTYMTAKTKLLRNERSFAYLTAKNKARRGEKLSPSEDQLFCDMAGHVLEVDT